MDTLTMDPTSQPSLLQSPHICPAHQLHAGASLHMAWDDAHGNVCTGHSVALRVSHALQAPSACATLLRLRIRCLGYATLVYSTWMGGVIPASVKMTETRTAMPEPAMKPDAMKGFSLTSSG
mmetsp:Transcript_38364/g.101149  ORF Transcript_38364/g.101149 Transcript_38364/m.101149 type:complete len:122 (-) Transcript_38364:163-528(-)